MVFWQPCSLGHGKTPATRAHTDVFDEVKVNFEYTPDEQKFRAEVREFLQKNLPLDLADKMLNMKRMHREDFVRWHKILAKQGWSAPGWPKQFGGTGWTAIQQHIFDEEGAEAGAPPLLAFSVRMVAPVLQHFGSKAQQDFFLPKILSGEHWWCQGYSEPGSGSDLASLKTRAERRGDKYIVNGQKTWNTLGQHADWIFCLVRTNTEVRQQEGISFLLIDMKTPGITVRPIKLIDGGETEVNEVWFDNVEVPEANRIGEENKGWTYAKVLLGHERVGIAQVGNSKRELKKLKSLAKSQRSGGKPLIEDSRFRDRVAELEIEIAALEITVLRVLSLEAKGGNPGPESSVLKIKGSEIQQTLTELKMLAIGQYAYAYVPEAAELGWQGDPEGAGSWGAFTARYFNVRKTTIFGGSNEIQRNIIAQRILGL
ncbi:MAG: acyl-CoA dehydrogenase family protein [Candidatus Obscuribacterales bacterium]|nr:acyl-CoA dehydrogenase family protein [Steroidobacteraceae bacterium]